MERSRARSNGLVLTLCVSVLLHLLLVPALQSLILNPLDEAPTQQRERAVTLLSTDQVRKMTRSPRRIPTPAIVPPPKVEKTKQPKIKPKGQVVEISKPKNTEAPKDARFLAEHNSKVEREQIAARKQAPTPKIVKSDRRLISPGDDVNGRRDGRKNTSRQKRVENKRPRRPEAGESDRKGQTSPSQKPLRADGKTTPNKTNLSQGDGRFRPDTQETQKAKSEANGGRKVGGSSADKGWRSLLPTLGPREVAQKDGSIDHVENVDEGDQTFLNAKEYRYAFFFNRVKRNVSERWRATRAHRHHDPYGRIYGVRDRLTVVQVTLSPHGDLDDVIITKDSGVAFLDEAALDAFRAAQPFPNPPNGLQDPDGRIRFRFGFFLEINSRGFRLFRSR
jgi:TonB family protein